jgi:rSAM/selenodomain-associated transferase 1
MDNSCVVMVFTRAPAAGEVMTRLINELGEEGAASLYRELLERTVVTAVEADVGDVQLHCWPDTQHPWLRAMQNDYPVELVRQEGMDLGGRMHHAFAGALVRYSRAIITGCDIPQLAATDLITACEKLAEKQAVLGPAEDGGYYLIGLSRPCPALFYDIEWGRDNVLAKTRDRIRQQGLGFYELYPRWDVDRPEDVQRYQVLKEREEEEV